MRIIQCGYCGYKALEDAFQIQKAIENEQKCLKCPKCKRKAVIRER